MATPADIAYQKAHISDNKQPGLIISTSIMLATGVLAVTARFIARRVMRVSYGADDWSILFALFSFIGFCAGHLLLTRYGYGRHTILVTDPIAFGKATLATESLYNPAIVGIKVSILCLYHRLFPSKRLLKVLWVVGAVVVAYSTTQFFAVIFQCTPMKGMWDPSLNPHCIKIGVLILIMSIMNIVTDVIILIIPLPIIWRLQMSTTRKIQVSGVFSMGICVVAISCVRANYVLLVGQKDPAWLLPPGSEITAIELGVAMLTACLPAYLPLIRYARYGPRALTRETTAASVSSKTGMTKMGVSTKLNPFKSSSPRQSSTSNDSYAYSGNNNRVQTQVEGRALGRDELSALEDQYGLNGRIIVTRSIATESHSNTS